jgi:hypothetical protein
MGFLSLVTMIGLFAASTAFATNDHIKGQSHEGISETVPDDVKSSDTAASKWRVVDSEGNVVYLLSPVKTPEGEVQVEYLSPYTEPINR